MPPLTARSCAPHNHLCLCACVHVSMCVHAVCRCACVRACVRACVCRGRSKCCSVQIPSIKGMGLFLVHSTSSAQHRLLHCCSAARASLLLPTGSTGFPPLHPMRGLIGPPLDFTFNGRCAGAINHACDANVRIVSHLSEEEEVECMFEPVPRERSCQHFAAAQRKLSQQRRRRDCRCWQHGSCRMRSCR